MRKENEVIEQVLQVAKQMEEIRAVIRTNLVPVRDYLHSYEFYFIVKDITVFDNDAIFEENGSHGNVWIGNTYLKLMDKDNSLPPIEKTKEVLQFFTERPTKENYLGTCAEFFWVLKTLAEYICRKELPTAMFYLNVSVRDMLNCMLR